MSIELNPRDFATENEYQNAVEKIRDAEMISKSLQRGELRQKERLRLLETKHGHQFNPMTRACFHCGISEKGYIGTLGPSTFPMEECKEKI